MSLKEYHKKRNFDKTQEPKGKLIKQNSKRFVIQFHQARAKHYDFRLEFEGVLLSWAVPKGLSNNPADKRLAVKVEDHPVDYIDFEGVIPKGNYGAGTVEIFDEGNYLELEPFKKGLKDGYLKFLLNGKKLKGMWSLIKTKDDNWLIIKSEDEFVGENNIFNLPFKKCEVQLATLTDKIPTGKDWIFEIKYDGYRMLAFVEKGNVTLFSKNNLDYTKKFQGIVASLKQLGQPSFVLDGEVVSFDEKGKTDFGLLQKNLKNGSGDFYYVVFDLLALSGEDLREKKLFERKSKLQILLEKAESNLIFSGDVDKGKECFEFAKKNNLEGIVAKRKNSKYSGNRSEDWLKIKCYHRQEFIIAGFTTSERNENLSSLLLGYYKNGELKYVGKVGTGFSEEQKLTLLKMFSKLKLTKSPFSEKIKEKNEVFLKPQLMAEIQYVELTKDGLLRQPSFIGLRNDKNVKDVVLEIIE